MSKRGRPNKVDSRLTRVSVRLTNRELARLKILSDEREFSLSQMIRYLINTYYER